MVVHGHDTTLPITMDEMIMHCKAVARGAQRAFLVGDLPFGSYELSTTEAVKSAIRMLKDGGMDAVKLEGKQASSTVYADGESHSIAYYIYAQLVPALATVSSWNHSMKRWYVLLVWWRAST